MKKRVFELHLHLHVHLHVHEHLHLHVHAHLYFSKCPNCFRRYSGKFVKTLKIRLKLVLNSLWAHAITY